MNAVTQALRLSIGLRIVLLLWVLLPWVDRLSGISLILRLILVRLRLIVIVGSPSILLRGDSLLRPNLLALFRVLLLTSVKELTTAIDRLSGVAPNFISVDLNRGTLTVSVHLEPTGHEGADQEHSNNE